VEALDPPQTLFPRSGPSPELPFASNDDDPEAFPSCLSVRVEATVLFPYAPVLPFCQDHRPPRSVVSYGIDLFLSNATLDFPEGHGPPSKAQGPPRGKYKSRTNQM